MARRGSSISLEEGPVPAERHSPQTQHSEDKSVYDPAKPPLLLFRPHELQTPTTIREASPEDGCPLLPSEPSLPSSPLVTAPMDVFLEYEDSHEMMRLGGVAPMKAAAQAKQLSPELAESSLASSSWQHMSDDVDPSPSDEAVPSKHGKAPCAPVLKPTATSQAKTESSSSYVNVDMIPVGPIEVEDNPPETPDADIPNLSLSARELLEASGSLDVGVLRQYRYD
ncbi:hypothetical protein ACHAPT_000601 [Fusarium lateritium]